MRFLPVTSRKVFRAAVLLLPSMLLFAGTVSADDAKRLAEKVGRIGAELARTNAQIAALKRSDRGVGDEYRLRKMMADAEALARKLTETEAELRLQGGAPPAAKVPLSELLAPDPAVAPGDGPNDLEAKAALLADQARRLTSESQSLSRAASQIRVRQTLRARAGQLDRDPFFGLDASKRTMVFSGPKSKSTLSGPGETAPKSGGGQGDTSADRSATTGAAGPPMSSPNTPSASQTTPSPVVAGSTPPAAGNAPTVVSFQFRTLLDQQTLAEIRRIEGSGRPTANAEALDKAASALNLRAQQLEAQAKLLRAKAKP